MEEKGERYEKLGKDNYFTWKLTIRALLVEKNCWTAIEPGYKEIPEEDLNQEQSRLNRKALNLIIQNVSTAHLEDIGDCNRALEAWEILDEIYATFTLLHTLINLRDMVNTEKTEDMSMTEYMSKIQGLNRKLAKGNIIFSDKHIAMFFLLGLPLDKYDGLVRSLEDEENLTSRKVKAKLLLEEN